MAKSWKTTIMTMKKKNKKKNSPHRKVHKKSVSGKKKAVKGPRMIKVASVTNPDVIFPLLAERADDLTIETEVTGKAAEYYIYEFPMEGKVVRGLSSKGVYETVRYINTNTAKTHMRLVLDKTTLHKEEVVRKENGKEVQGIEVTVWADDLVSGQAYPGVKFEAYEKKGKNGWYSNTFAIEKATTKAVRNAFRRHFPEQLVQKVIAKFAKDKSRIMTLNSAPEGFLPNQSIAAPKSYNPPINQKTVVEVPKSIAMDYVGKLNTYLERHPKGPFSTNEKMRFIFQKTNIRVDWSKITQPEAQVIIATLMRNKK